MPYILEDLVIDRVDLVDEGANSAAFIEVFKRKEQETVMDFSEIISKLKPEHASVIQHELDAANAELEKARNENIDLQSQLEKANGALAAANEELEVLKAKECDTCECDGEADENGTCKACGKPKKKGTGFDEAEVLKAMPAAAREAFEKMRAQKEAAEEQVRKAAEEKIEAEAVAKAATMKSLPVEQKDLVEILKSCSPEVVAVLEAASNAIDGVVLDEVGKSKPVDVATGADSAWAQIEAKAEEIAKRDSVTKQRAIGIAIKENPELYKEYLDGGAN